MSSVDKFKTGHILYPIEQVGESVPFDLRLPVALRKAGWKVKIFDREIREPPHITIIRKKVRWRINLRTGKFMDKQPNPTDVPAEVSQVVRSNWTMLRQRWDERYPYNPTADNED